MSDSLETVAVADLQEGQVLAQDVTDKNGRVLLPAGCVLKEAHRKSLIRHFIETVTIDLSPAAEPGGAEEDDPTSAVPEAERERRAAVCARIDHMFGEGMDDPTMKLIRALAVRYAQEGKLRG